METAYIKDVHGDEFAVRIDYDDEIVIEPQNNIDVFYYDLDGAKKLRDALDKAIAEVEGRAK